jgi:hypothetical protein
MILPTVLVSVTILVIAAIAFLTVDSGEKTSRTNSDSFTAQNQILTSVPSSTSEPTISSTVVGTTQAAGSLSTSAQLNNTSPTTQRSSGISPTNTATPTTQRSNVTSPTNTATPTTSGSNPDTPLIQNVSVSPSTVAVGGSVTIEYTVIDSGGITFTTGFWRNPSGRQVDACPNGGGLTRISGDSTNATYRTTCNLPSSGIPSGTYTVQLTANDNAGNTGQTTTQFIVTGGTSDETAPVIQNISVSPSTVAVGGSVTIEYTVIDSGGITFTTGFWGNPSLRQVDACPNGGGLTRISGDSTNATYRTTCNLPSSGIPSGTYTVQLRANDNAGNIGAASAQFTVS